MRDCPRAVNDPPEAFAQSVTTDEDTARAITLTGGLDTHFGTQKTQADNQRAGFDALRGSIGAMDPDTQAQLITARSGLETAGLNPFLQNAAQRSLERTLGGYRDWGMANRGQPQATSTKLWDYLVNAGLDPFAYGGR